MTLWLAEAVYLVGVGVAFMALLDGQDSPGRRLMEWLAVPIMAVLWPVWLLYLVTLSLFGGRSKW